MPIEDDDEAMAAINYLKACGYTCEAVCEALSRASGEEFLQPLCPCGSGMPALECCL